MDVEVALDVSNDLFAANGIAVQGDLINLRFVIGDNIYDEPQLYNMLAAQDTPEASCLFLWTIERLSQLRRDCADAHPDQRNELLERVRAAYIRYECYCRSVIDDVDIDDMMTLLTL